MRVLVTAARLPVARELARALHAENATVFMCDCLQFPLGRFSHYVQGYIRLPSPSFDCASFRQKFLDALERNHIDLVVPVHEDTLHLASFSTEIEWRARLFCPSFEILKLLHSKAACLEMVRGCGAEVPETFRVTDKEQLEAVARELEDYILKPEYSRGAFFACLDAERANLDSLPPKMNNAWVVQRRIKGTECCTYSIALDGELLAHACYRPTYRVGQGAGIFFEPYQSQLLHSIVARIARKHRLTGQISFDFILAPDGQPFIIECNPRATAGAQLLDQTQPWGRAFVGPNDHTFYGMASSSRMASAVVLGCCLIPEIRAGRGRAFMRNFIEAKDVVMDWGDPLPSLMQLVGLLEIMKRSRELTLPLDQAFTRDLEWNNEELC